MPLNAADVAALSRLLDEAAALPADQQAAWLAALPAPQQHLVPHLRRMLALTAGYRTDALLSEHLPQLPDLRDEREPDGMPGDVIGPYRLKSVLGRGGMGTVWLAERADGIFEREVALKLPVVDRGPQLAERMARERQIAARLEHPNIARLYEAGIDPHGRPYLVLERVQGLGLLAHCDTHRLPRDARLRLLLQLCAAVAHAHAQLVVHRDIKPSNLMVDSAGQLKLLDFGISRWLQGPAGGGIGTGTSTDLGHTHTPGYAAPEQREGRPVSTRADIYSIGAVAHVLLTGDLPPPGAGAAPVHRARLGPDLHAVLDQALQADPALRYSSVERLADDLRCVLAQRPVQARRAGWPHRTALFVRRHRRPLVAAAAAGLLLASAIGVALQRHARERAQQEQTAQARNFLFAFMEDADFTEGTSSAPITAAQMIERAIQRARDDFPGQPALRGSVLANLGIVLRRLDPGQPQRALALLREAHGLLEAGAEPDDPALHIARAQLAMQLLQASPPDPPAARRLAEQALTGCTSTSVRCARARAYAHAALRNVSLRAGELQAAVAHAERAVAENGAGFGTDHADSALSRLHLAQVLRNAGLLLRAADTLALAQQAAARATLRAASRRELMLWAAILHADLGHHEEALAQLAALAEIATPRDQPALHRTRAQSLQAQGRWPAALADAEAAIAAAADTGNDWEATFAHQARARALSVLGRHDEAQAALQRATEGLARQGIGEQSLTRLRALRIGAELLLRRGDVVAARAQLLALIERHKARPAPGAAVDLAQALDLLGAAERREGRLAAAGALHAEAAALLAGALPSDHPLRLRNALDAALAQALGDAPAPASADALAAAVQRYLDRLPPDSAWRQVLGTLPAQPAAGISWVL